MSESRRPVIIIIGLPGLASVESALEYAPGKVTRSSHSGILPDDPRIAEMVAAGVPLVDMRPMEYGDAVQLAMSGPMVSVGEPDDSHWSQFEPGKGLDGCGYGPLGYAPVPVYVELARKRGARVLNA